MWAPGSSGGPFHGPPGAGRGRFVTAPSAVPARMPGMVFGQPRMFSPRMAMGGSPPSPPLRPTTIGMRPDMAGPTGHVPFTMGGGPGISMGGGPFFLGPMPTMGSVGARPPMGPPSSAAMMMMGGPMLLGPTMDGGLAGPFFGGPIGASFAPLGARFPMGLAAGDMGLGAALSHMTPLGLSAPSAITPWGMPGIRSPGIGTAPGMHWGGESEQPSVAAPPAGLLSVEVPNLNEPALPQYLVYRRQGTPTYLRVCEGEEFIVTAIAAQPHLIALTSVSGLFLTTPPRLTLVFFSLC